MLSKYPIFGRNSYKGDKMAYIQYRHLFLIF